MALSNFPPGHPTGVSYAAYEMTCENGHTAIVHDTYERDVNYHNLDPEDCPECGAEFVMDSAVEEDDGPDPDRQRDEAWDRENLP